MLRVAVLALLVSLVAASEIEDLKRLVAKAAGHGFNEIDAMDIQLYERCEDIEKFDSRLLGWWKGRSQKNAVHYLKDYDYHFIKKDGTGVLNKINTDDHDKLVNNKPKKMWCKTELNLVDKSVKVQYGPTEYGQLVCINLQIPSGDESTVEIQVNQVLFTDARVPMKFPSDLDCLNYPYQSKFDSYTVWADQLYAPSSELWTRTKEPSMGSGWKVDEGKRAEMVKQLLKVLSK